MTYALVIGGANIDFVGIPDNPLIWHDKNPGTITTSLGGVGRNIAENLARLGVSTKLLSVAGDDAYGAYLIDETTKVGVDMSNVQILQNQRSSVYFSVMDGKDDMAVALSDMAIVDQLTPKLLAPYASLIRGAQLVILDTNLLTETLSYLLTHFPTTRFLVDTVSVSKAAKIQSLLPHIDTLKPNRLEAELLAEMPINTVSDAFSAADKLLKKGVKRVFISLGAEGSIYVDKQKQLHGRHSRQKSSTPPVPATP